jgi:oligoribonuclease|tara:strand:+ start:167 stop:724 length:558 start_codon:yes stop_codon:yes gene_type:complete
MKNSNDKNKLIWIDLEMTGLDTQRDNIIEIASIVTDYDLSVVAEGPVIAIHQSQEIMSAMDHWNTKHHGNSGLIEKVLNSSITMQEAEQETLDFLSKYVAAGASPLCGNGICQDRRFLARQMCDLEKFFHYRNLDVSTIKILAQIWKPGVAKNINKQSKHRALDDIKDSINELSYYRSSFFDLDE